MQRQSINQQARFWSRVSKSNDCWIWTGKRNASGYGRLRIDGKYVLAHRFVLGLVGIDVPADAYVCHRCDTPPCVNPMHLFLGTPAENIRDAGDKGRMPWGERHHGAKLTAMAVREIRTRFRAGQSRRDLARDFAVDYTTIRGIVSRKRWRHLGDLD